ncbi:MAG TPA: hypothetical protein VF378_00275 [Geothrix sp.]
MKKTIRLLFKREKGEIPKPEFLEGTGAVFHRSTWMTTGEFFEYVIEYAPATLTTKGKETLEAWRKQAHSVEDPWI